MRASMRPKAVAKASRKQSGAYVLTALPKYPQSSLYFYRFIDKERDKERIEDRYTGGLSRRDDAGIDSSENYYRRKEGPEALFEERPEALFVKLIVVRHDLLFIFSVDRTVDDGIDHEADADEQSRQYPGEEQRSRRYAGSQRIEHEWDARRDYDAQTSRYRHHRRAETLVISERNKERDRHSADGGRRRGP